MRRLLVLLATGLLALASCSSDSGTTVSAIDLVSAAPDKTVDAGSARFAMKATMDLGQGTVRINADGESAFHPTAAHLRMTMSGVPQIGDQQMEAVLTDGVMFMGGGIFAQGLPPGKKWISLDLDKIGEMAGVDMSQLTGGQNDPTQSLAFLKGADDVEEVGKEEIRGVETTHYKATVDLRKAAKEAGAVTDPKAFDRLVDQLGKSSFPVEAWIDDDGLPRRMSFDMPVPATGGKLATEMEYFDFGADVSVEAPPKSEVVDFSAFLQQMQQQSQQQAGA